MTYNCQSVVTSRSPYSHNLFALHASSTHYTVTNRTLNFGIQGGGNREQLLTPKPQASEGELNDFVGLCEALCRRLLQLFALGLQVLLFLLGLQGVQS